MKTLTLLLSALQVSVALGFAIGLRPRTEMTTTTSLHTWWHDTSDVNTATAMPADAVRRSRKYNVSVSIAEQDRFQNSFVYETIPRNGNGKMYDPAQPGREYNLTDGDGITIEIEEGINMAWSQFEYNTDVDVKIVSTDGSNLGSTSEIVIRPKSLHLQAMNIADDTVVVRVPYTEMGHRFSIEFGNDIFQYRTNGSRYVSSGGLVVSEEPRNALAIFASPFLKSNLIPSKTSPDTQVMRPGAITEDSIPSKPTLYFEAGVYWTEKDGLLGKSHIKLDPNTHYIYLESGAYVKGAFEYTTSNLDFYTIGHGIISGENYAYMANTNKSYVAEKDDRTSLRMISHGSVTSDQKWHCEGPTLNAPPFNSVDLFPANHHDHEEDNKVMSEISDYKQVGAFYVQTDGPQIYAGTVRDVFWHVNDDGVKLYHSNTDMKRITIWKCHNDPVVQMGWTPRNVSNVTMEDLTIIHNRWYQSNTVVPSSIIGASPYYADPKLVDYSRTITASLKNITCEGRCAALLRIAPLQNYDLVIEDVKIDELLSDEEIQLGQSLVGMKISETEDDFVEGQQNLTVGISVRNWTVGDQKVDATNWKVGQLGQVNLAPEFNSGWSIG